MSQFRVRRFTKCRKCCNSLVLQPLQILTFPKWGNGGCHWGYFFFAHRTPPPSPFYLFFSRGNFFLPPSHPFLSHFPPLFAGRKNGKMGGGGNLGKEGGGGGGKEEEKHDLSPSRIFPPDDCLICGALPQLLYSHILEDLFHFYGWKRKFNSPSPFSLLERLSCHVFNQASNLKFYLSILPI